jgi:hypothetical protein
MSIKLTKNGAQMVIVLTPCQWRKRKIANRYLLFWSLFHARGGVMTDDLEDPRNQLTPIDASGRPVTARSR